MTILATYATMRTWFASPVATVLGTANAGGLVRLQVDTTAKLPTGTKVLVSGIVGTVEANGPGTVTHIDGTHADIQGSAFSNAWISGGKVYLLANDGMAAFPGPQLANGSVSNAGTSKLRASGFASSWKVTTAGGTIWSPAQTGAIGPLIAGAVPGGDPLFPITVTIDAGADDGGVAAYAWWLSQRGEPVRLPSIDHPTDVQVLNQPQPLIVQHPDNHHSGTVHIAYNSAEIVKLFPSSGGTPPTDAGSLLTLFNGCQLYVSRLSDQAFQAASLVAAQ